MYLEQTSYIAACNDGLIDHSGIVRLEYEAAELIADGDAKQLVRWILAREGEFPTTEELKELAEVEVERDEMESACDEMESHRDEMESERDDAESERDDAEAAHAKVESHLDDLRDSIDGFLTDCADALLDTLADRLTSFADLSGMTDEAKGLWVDKVIDDLSTEFHMLASDAGVE